MPRLAAVTALALLMSGCSYFDQLNDVGRAPPLSPISNPNAKPNYRPVGMPMPMPEPAVYNANSLWRSGSRAFFKDQRAARVGDLLTVIVNFTDRAQFDNATRRELKGKEALGFNGFFGLNKKVEEWLPEGTDASALVDIQSEGRTDGKGKIDREERVAAKIAAVVTQKLPNGNMVIEGRQEVRVNFEVREVIVAGVVRPEDITSENTIPFAKIAEARVSYGGRGVLTTVQQPRYGQQVLDILLPF